MLAIEAIKRLSRDSLSALTVLAGDDQGQFSQVKETLLQQVGYDPSDLSQAYFDMRESDFEEVAMDLESMPFFSEDKLVILDDLQDITTTKKRYLSDDQLKRLETYLESPLETTKLILIAPGKLDSKRRLVKLLKRDGQVFEASEPKEADLRSYFQKRLVEQGLLLNGANFETLLVKSNFDFSQIEQNIGLLLAYKGPGPIDETDLQAALPKSLQDNIFDLTQLTLTGKIALARDLVRDLRLQGEDEIKLIAVMLNQIRFFLHLKILQEQGQRESQFQVAMSEALGRSINPYQIKYALRDGRTFSLKTLEGAIKCLIETDYQIKSGYGDKTFLFDLALLKISQGSL